VTKLVSIWAWLRSQMGGVNRQISAAISVGLARLRSRGERLEGASSWHFVNPRRLSPRQQVLFYYLAMVRRGGDRGVRRKSSQTPSEYSHSLVDALLGGAPNQDALAPGHQAADTHAGALNKEPIGDEIAVITDRFIEARYSTRQVSRQEASLAQRSWQRIRRVLRRPLEKERKTNE